MKTWADYKNHVKKIDSDTAKELAEIEENTKIISAMIQHSFLRLLQSRAELWMMYLMIWKGA